MQVSWTHHVNHRSHAHALLEKKTLTMTTGNVKLTAVAPEIEHLEASHEADNAHLLRQSRVSRPTAKLIDGNNHEKATLTFQRAAVAAEIACVEASASHAAAATHRSISESPSTPSPQTPQPTLSVISTGACTGSSDSSFTGTSFTHESSINQTQDELDEGPRVTQSKNKRRQIISFDEDDDEALTGKKKKKTKVNSNCKF